MLTLSLALLLFGCSDEGTDNGQETPVDEDPVEEVDSGEETANEDENEDEGTDPVDEEPEEIRVSFYGAGDNLIHPTVYDDARLPDGSYDFAPMYRNIQADAQAADIAYINQESLIGGDELGISGYPVFNTPSDMIPSLVEVGFNLVTSSNNHTLDKGTLGVMNTVKLWREYEEDITFTGAFESQEHRDTIPVIERNGVTFSILSYTYSTNGVTPEYPYLVNYFDPALIRSDVERAKEVSDFVMVAAHWGDEDTHQPNAFQLEYAKLFADLEVDVVLGTHSHTIQPMEWVEGESGHETLVMYSTGNFLSGQIWDQNVLGSTYGFEFVKKGDEKSIENVYVEPIVTHYNYAIPGDVMTRENFEIIKLKDYTPEHERAHGLYTNPAETVTKAYFDQLVNEVYDQEFLITE